MTWLQKAWGLGLLVVAVLAGCECDRPLPPPPPPQPPKAPWPLDIEVTVDGAGFQSQLGTIPSLEVNLVGVTTLELGQWQKLSMTAYWMPDNAQRLRVLRGQLAHRMNFGQERPTTLVLGRTDPVWERWAARQAVKLFVVVNYPRACKDQYGNDDPRRLILPWGGEPWRRWSMRDEWTINPEARIRIEVTPAGVTCNTPPESR